MQQEEHQFLLMIASILVDTRIASNACVTFIHGIARPFVPSPLSGEMNAWPVLTPIL